METNDHAAGQRPGPTGERVGRNIKALRGRITVRELSARLAQIGQPIVPSGITKIEMGARRVHVEDLVALAIVLNVSPNRILLDPEADEGPLELTTKVVVTRRRAWSWATGGRPLFDSGSSADPTFRAFRRENRPDDPGPTGTQLAELVAIGQRSLGPVADAVRVALRSENVTFDKIMEYLHFAYAVDQATQAITDAHPDNPENQRPA